MPFSKLGLHAQLVHNTRRMRYTEPTPIQAEAIPVILAGRDLIATAQTGTGKTAAYGLPLLEKLAAQNAQLRPKSAQALVLVPTRELAIQVHDSLTVTNQSLTARDGADVELEVLYLVSNGGPVENPLPE